MAGRLEEGRWFPSPEDVLVGEDAVDESDDQRELAKGKEQLQLKERISFMSFFCILLLLRSRRGKFVDAQMLFNNYHALGSLRIQMDEIVH